MLQTIEALIDQNGVLRLLEPIELPKLRRVSILLSTIEALQMNMPK